MQKLQKTKKSTTKVQKQQSKRALSTSTVKKSTKSRITKVKIATRKQQIKSATPTSTIQSRSIFGTGGNQKDAQVNLEQGLKFYQDAKASNDYTEHPSGFLYRFKSNNGQSYGGNKPEPDSRVTVHYTGRLINGKVFDSSYDRGETITFGLNEVISGWGLAVQLMSPNDKIECILPSNLAYGARGAGSVIGPNSTLIFDIELFEPQSNAIEKAGNEYYAKEKATGQYHEHPTGFLYKYIGTNNVNNTSINNGQKPLPTNTVDVDYQGTLIDGTIFDSSYKRGKSIQFPLNHVIPGWTLAVSECMTVGDKIHVILPPHLAYGDRDVGPIIKAGSTLCFDIELHKIM